MTHRFLRRAVPLLCATIAAAAVLTGTGVLTTSTATAATAPPWDGTLWSTQLDFDNNGTPWSTASFTALKAKGLNSVEIDMPWNGIEPANGSFNFTELDQELANAASAGIRIVPIFWQSGWSGSPASWITGREVTSTGTQGVQPVWWDPTGQPAYFTYVSTTIRHIAANPGYGGSVLDYGFLDAQWDINGGAGGWAQADIDEFHNTYLPQTFGTIAAFNSANATSFTSFSQVPAAVSGQPLAGVYQAFRAWSVQDTYNRLAV
ncbi:MAG TPA: beta-galactosidase, partial [Pseudonocardiaceae bacterium]|nr:beta-galactosidase [Pseudonocardiaceae bacterium]